MHLAVAGVVAGVVAALLMAPAPPPTTAECFASYGFPVDIDADGGVEIPLLVNADNNAGQAWKAQADLAMDNCTT